MTTAKRLPSYYIYAFKGDKLYAAICHIGAEVAPIVRNRRREGWKVFFRKLSTV